ncbi:MAG: hypothetical protein F2520_02605 [Actinobacteria bacterium]|nr:hypothetical protein [Actinomycetota bacterium]MTA77137.1 hypothetical protein [Actinomycetota bacterium]
MSEVSRRRNLTEPVSDRSRLTRCGNIELGQLLDDFVLLDPLTRGTCLLDAETARVWFECDGRPIADVLRSISRDSPELDRNLLDTIRALRLLGMIEDALEEEPLWSGPGPLVSPLPRAMLPDFDDHSVPAEAIAPGATKAKPRRLLTTAREGETEILYIVEQTINEEQELGIVDALSTLAVVLNDCSVDVLVQICGHFRVLIGPPD